jgi:hypothetical protein
LFSRNLAVPSVNYPFSSPAKQTLSFPTGLNLFLIPTLPSKDSMLNSLANSFTVPEISMAVSVLSRYLKAPGPAHMALAKKVLRYLQGRKAFSLSCCAQDTQAPYLPGQLYGYADASFADVKPDRKSSYGYVFFINNAAVSWRATKTPLITLNAAESEVVALSAAAQEAVYLRKLCNELGFTQSSPSILYEDCEAAVALSKENRFRNRSKHILLRWSYVCERQRPKFGDLQVVSVSRKIMIADILASPRPDPQRPVIQSYAPLPSPCCTLHPRFPDPNNGLSPAASNGRNLTLTPAAP